MWPNNDPELMALIEKMPPPPDSFTKIALPEIRKIGVVMQVSTEVYEQAMEDRKRMEFYLSHRKEIKAQNAAFATYWPNHESFDNPNIVRGYN